MNKASRWTWHTSPGFFVNRASQRSAPGKVAPRAKPVGSSGILYHGGPLLSSPNVYFIWYGNWSGNDATTILTHLAGSIGGSPYFNINTTYSDGNGTAVINVVNYAGSTSDDGYSQGTALSDAGVEAVVAGAISGGKLPADSKGVYFVLTSADVNETSGFCTQYCGWHGHGTIFGADTKYAFVGNPDRCPDTCEAQTTKPRPIPISNESRRSSPTNWRKQLPTRTSTPGTTGGAKRMRTSAPGPMEPSTGPAMERMRT